jgi:hypothetical protein
MYCKGSAMQAVFAQYETGIIDEFVLSAHVTRWITVFSVLPSSSNSFLMSALADSCIEYQLDDFKSQFVGLCDKGLSNKNFFDEDRFKECEVKAWNKSDAPKLIESGILQTEFNLIDTLNSWIEDEDENVDDSILDNLSNSDTDLFDSLMGEGGLLSNVLYDEKAIIDNSVPVSSLSIAGRNDPCPCGSGKKYKKCCLQ